MCASFAHLILTYYQVQWFPLYLSLESHVLKMPDQYFSESHNFIK